jgi:hypothetical protein
MKKILILFLFVSQLSFGQMKFGVKGGIGDAWFNRGQGNQTLYPGLAIGGFMNYASGKISFQPELLLSHKGSGFLYYYTGYNQKARSNASLNYLEIPLSVYYSIKDADATPYLGIGLAPAILLSSKVTVRYPDGTKVSIPNYRTNQLDLGFLFTGGYRIDNYFVEARINLGLTRVYPSPSSISNSVFMFMGGMRF